MGIIETSSGQLDEIKEEIKKMKGLTSKPFSVNIAQHCQRSENYRFCNRPRNGFVTTSAGNPTRYTEELKKAGLVVFHVVPTLSAAKLSPQVWTVLQ